MRKASCESAETSHNLPVKQNIGPFGGSDYQRHSILQHKLSFLCQHKFPQPEKEVYRMSGKSRSPLGTCVVINEW